MGGHQEIIARELPGLEERWRPTVDGLPDAFTREGDWHHWICAITATKNAVKLVIHKGALLADPRAVMEGQGRYARSIPFRSPNQIDADVVAILREAAARQTEM